MMKNPLDLIETRLQSLIESSQLLLPGSSPTNMIAHLFTEAINSHLISDGNEGFVASNEFIIHVHPQSLPLWMSIEDQIGQILVESAAESGLIFSASPEIQIVVNPSLHENEIKIENHQPDFQTDNTAIIYPNDDNLLLKNTDPQTVGGYLIIDGGELFPLEHSVVNIGRLSDNHLVIDDPRVSRKHCQLRFIHQHYILFDLNSTGGTFVNNIHIRKQALKPGDVISLAGFQLIYGEDQSIESQTTGKIRYDKTGPIKTGGKLKG